MSFQSLYALHHIGSYSRHFWIDANNFVATTQIVGASIDDAAARTETIFKSERVTPRAAHSKRDTHRR